MAEIISLQTILQARRRQREQECLHTCVETIEQSLRIHLQEFTSAPAEEKLYVPVRFANSGSYWNMQPTSFDHLHNQEPPIERMSMAKVASSSTTKRTGAPKNATASAKARSRSAKETAEKEVPELSLALAPDSVLTPPPTPPTIEPPAETVQLLTERINALEEKITASVSALASVVQALKSTEAPPSPENAVPSETVLPVIADVIRRSLMEQLNPLVASLKRIEERVGFIGNRLKHPGQSPEQRQKPPWRHDQQQRHGSRPRGPNGGPRPNQGQTWTPPSAASVQGHFAPRPLRGGETDHFTEDEE